MPDKKEYEPNQKDQEKQRAKINLFNNKIVDVVTGAYLVYMAILSFGRRSEVPVQHATFFLIGALLLLLAGIFFLCLAARCLIQELFPPKEK